MLEIQSPKNLSRRMLLAGAAAVGAGVSLPAYSQTTKITYGFTAGTDFSSVFVAIEQGFFAKRNIEVEAKFIPLNATLPAALQSDSLQIAGCNPTVFLQAVDGGLDHVVVAGGSVTSKSITAFGLVARAGSGIRSAQDCIGKKVGVPGFGAFLHVTFREWLKSQGVDPKKVTFVEAAFPQQGDLLRGGSLDAVIGADPFMSRIVETGFGYVVSYYTTFLPEGQPIILQVAKREWAQKNQVAVRAFQEALQEAVKYMSVAKNSESVRAILGKHIKLPPAVLAKMQISAPSYAVTPENLKYWIGVMQSQEMMSNKFDVNRLIFK